MRRRLIGLAFGTYVAIVAVGVFGPEPSGLVRDLGDAASVVPTAPFAGATQAVGDFLQTGSGEDFREENFANIVLFVPASFMFPLLWPRWRRWTVPAGVALSMGIELTQMVLLSWRTPSIEDIVWNSVGTVIGFTLWWVWARIRSRGSAPVSSRSADGPIPEATGGR